MMWQTCVENVWITSLPTTSSSPRHLSFTHLLSHITLIMLKMFPLSRPLSDSMWSLHCSMFYGLWLLKSGDIKWFWFLKKKTLGGSVEDHWVIFHLKTCVSATTEQTHITSRRRNSLQHCRTRLFSCSSSSVHWKFVLFALFDSSNFETVCDSCYMLKNIHHKV